MRDDFRVVARRHCSAELPKCEFRSVWIQHRRHERRRWAASSMGHERSAYNQPVQASDSIDERGGHFHSSARLLAGCKHFSQAMLPVAHGHPEPIFERVQASPAPAVMGPTLTNMGTLHYFRYIEELSCRLSRLLREIEPRDDRSPNSDAVLGDSTHADGNDQNWKPRPAPRR